MEKTEFYKVLEKAVPQLYEGAFLVSGDEANPMTIGWATFGVVWNKPICTVFVRHSRYTHTLLEKSDEFVVSIPANGEMKKQLGICGSKSGRDCDKKALAQLNLVNADGANGIDGCKIHFVCRTVAKSEIETKNISAETVERFYNTNQATPDGDPHTAYFAEIISCRTDER